MARRLTPPPGRVRALDMQAVIMEAVGRDAPHPNTVRLALERRREEQQRPPPVTTMLSEHAQTRDVTVQEHRLDSYDQLTQENDNEESN